MTVNEEVPALRERETKENQAPSPSKRNPIRRKLFFERDNGETGKVNAIRTHSSFSLSAPHHRHRTV